MTTPLYIDVAISLPVYQTYTYSVPEQYKEAISPGVRVFVQFGAKKVTGYTLSFVQQDSIVYDGKILSILDVLDDKPIFPETMIPFYKWIAEYYIYPIGEVIKNGLPKKINLYEHTFFDITEKGKAYLLNPAIKPKIKIDILNAIAKKEMTIKSFKKKFGTAVSLSLLYGMEKDELVEKRSEIRGKSAFKRKSSKDQLGEEIVSDTPPMLTTEQSEIVNQISSSLNNGFKTWLLAGVTGSGKTEVYMRLAAKAVEMGRSALILVPEISLISQIERRFKARFGECIAVLHSNLSDGERYREWMRIINKDATIAIGVRSSIFAPFDNLGIIIVDEEHDTSYKDGGGFGYNAKDLAVVRAKLSNASAVLGSATPSIVSYYNVIAKKYAGVYLKERIEKRELPCVELIDMRKKGDLKGIERFITSELRHAIAENLKLKKQTLLFLNRRGFANLPICVQCGLPLKCKNCDISLTLHKKDNIYKCHLCGYFKSSKASCNICGSPNIKQLGFGTEKIESIISTLFPKAKVIRIDHDTTTKKGSMIKLLKEIKNRKTDIIIGTQMIAKGHDFPNITLVGVICADISLNIPDFRSGEQTFQLLAQVAGRAGRGDTPGKVILQTFNPAHFAIKAAKEQDFLTFYHQEISFRSAIDYPPFSRLIQIKIESKLHEKAKLYAHNIGELSHKLKKSETDYNSIEILGPVEAPIAKVASMFRWQILIKGKNSAALHSYIKHLFFNNQNLFKTSGVKTTIDVDPFFMM